MKVRRFPIHIVLLLLVLCFIPGTLANDPINWNEEGALSKENFVKNFAIDPAGGFKVSPTQAWDLITQSPDLLKDSKVLSIAFNPVLGGDPKKAASIINGNTNLLTDTAVLEEFDQAAKSDVLLLNNNPAAKSAWIKSKYTINMADSKVKITKYDGEKITVGSSGTAFRADDFPKATILENGCLKPVQGGIFCATSSLSLKPTVGTNPKNNEAIYFSEYVVQGGSVEFKDVPKEEIYINA
ncbi:MAG: hypothetical protein QF460_03235, partial [Candidatus Nanoarchaeia archaeon]|nr:hypothetical protein [Candidatus Nanoarchaeia archaeon]